MSRPRILVINPNSNQLVTQGLEQALKPLDFESGPEIVCETLTEGPYGIESQADVDGVAMPLRRRCAASSKATTIRPPSSSPATAIRACMSAAKPPTGPCSASPNAAC